MLLLCTTLLAVLITSWSSQAHPNAACQVSSHTTLAATSETDLFINPKATAIGYDVIVVYEKVDGNELYAVHGYPNEMTFNDAGGYWDMDVHFDQNEPFIVTNSAIKGSAQIATFNGKFIIVYSESNQVVTSKFVSSSFDGVEASRLDISTNLEPSFSNLVSSNQSGLFFGAIQGNNVLVYHFFDDGDDGEIAAWEQMDTTGLVEAKDGPIAIALANDSSVVMIVYHSTIGDEIACAIAATVGSNGVFEQTNNQPAVIGTSVALASGGPNMFMVLSNNLGQIEASFTTNNGETWSSSQTVEPEGDVDVNSPVGLVKTTFKWVPIWINKAGSVQSKPTFMETPTTSDWATIPKTNFFTGTGSLIFFNPDITATNGAGWTLAAVDNRTSDISFRACFDVPEQTSAPVGEPDRTTPSPTTSDASVPTQFVNPIVLLVLALIHFVQ